jgi:hypothetical protein
MPAAAALASGRWLVVGVAKLPPMPPVGIGVSEMPSSTETSSKQRIRGGGDASIHHTTIPASRCNQRD